MKIYIYFNIVSKTIFFSSLLGIFHVKQEHCKPAPHWKQYVSQKQKPESTGL